MQKIAYSTLAIAAPVVLQGCSEEDEQTTAPPVDCSTLSETECKATDNAQCNWDQLDSVPENCSAPEDFRDTLASFNDDPQGCTDYGGVRVQPCKKIKECSDYLLAEESTLHDDIGENRNSGVISFAEISAALGPDSMNQVLKVYFSNANTSTFIPVGEDASNPDNLCVGWLRQNANPAILDLSPDEVESSGTTFDCGASAVVEDSFNAAGSYAGVAIQYTVDDFANNKIYDALFYDACNSDTMCGMDMVEGTCGAVEDFCAQFDATTCPTIYVKDNVGFVQGIVNTVEAEVIANSQICQFQHAIDDPILDEAGQPTGELYLENIGCQTLDGLELVTCGASPVPSFGEFDAPNPQDPTLDEVEGEDMCSLWLADAANWEGDNQSARAIYYCPEDGESARLNDGTGEVECVSAAGVVNVAGPSLATRGNTSIGLANGRACQIVGEANESNFVKECALPREFSCGEPLDGADAGEECIKTNICVYDNGDRFECAESDASVSGSGGRVGDDDADDDDDDADDDDDDSQQQDQ
jgi:hypothetical protein